MRPLFGPGRGSGPGFASNGMAAVAEALRLPGETGKVGVERFGRTPGWYFDEGWAGDPDGGRYSPGTVAEGWHEAMREITWSYDTVGERLGLLDAYASADPATRAEWHRDTAALTETEVA